MKARNQERRRRRMIGLGVVVLGLLLLIHLGQFGWQVLASHRGAPPSGLGLVGGAVAGFFWSLLGVLSLVFPAILILAGIGVLALRERARVFTEAALILGTGVLLGTFFQALPALSPFTRATLGGSVGRALHAFTVRLVGDAAAFMLLGGALLVVTVAVIDFEVPGPGPLLPLLQRAGRAAWRSLGGLFRASAPRDDRGARKEKERAGSAGETAKRPKPAKERAEAGATRAAPAAAASEARPAEPRVAIMEPPREARAVAAGTSGPSVAAGGESGARRSSAQQPAARQPASSGGRAYVLPPLDLLADPTAGGPSISKEALIENSRTLEAKLADFGVKASVNEVHPGPVITRYELEPAPGVKVGQIANLADDLALGMRAKAIRIVAPIPGKGAVGVEIPNPEPRTVYLKEVLGSSAFVDARSLISIGFGKDISGKAFVTTLEEMPHLLIAGATGAGKSVSMHVLISSILFKAQPTDVRFLMIDPKMLELTVYNDIPHLIRPVVTDPREAAKALRWVIDEMERRYKTLARVGVRNIAGFNEWLDKGTDKSWGEDAPPKPLPLLVVVIDEYADLVLTLGSEVEEPIAKLAQMARAVGIHLVVATQRPSVDVITGVIKANFPSRIAFQVASKVDSRTILDINGAEKLLGKGDMLFLKTGRPAPDRVHGAFISNEETAAIVDFIKEQCFVVEQHGIDIASEQEQDRPFNGNAEDELFEEAVKLVVRHQIASVSMLQRRLKVGFSRAGRLMDIMERAGIVGPFEGSKAREVFLKPSEMAHADRDADD